MAARKRAKAPADTNPSTVLVVFLVFFILLSIGLGVWGYFGQKKVTQQADAAKKAKEDATKSDQGRDWYQLQALWAKAAEGHNLVRADGVDEPNDLVTRLDELNSKFSSERNKAAVEKMVEEDKKALGWDDRAKKFTTTYRKQYEELVKERDQLLKDKKALEDELKATRERENKRDTTFAGNWTNLKNEVATVNKNAEAAIKGAHERVQEANASKTKVLEQTADRIKELEDRFRQEAKKYNQTLKDKDDEIAKLKIKQEQIMSKVAPEKVASVDLLSHESPRGKIVRVDVTGRMPYINLGSADGVKEQLTFSIFGHSPSGQMAKDPKGSLEVVRVLDAHLSQTRVTHLSDMNADPVQEGDLVFNPAWNPSHRTHVAIAGIIDFTGEPPDSPAEQSRALREFMRSLERQGVVVDAYVDLRDQTVKGQMTLKTDYFILGEGPSYEQTRVIDTKDRRFEAKQKVTEAMAKMRQEAVQKGVTVVPLAKFAVMTGYRTPRASRARGFDYRSVLPTERKDAGDRKAATEEKPKDEDKGDKMDEKKGGKKLGEEKKDDDK